MDSVQHGLRHLPLDDRHHTSTGGLFLALLLFLGGFALGRVLDF